MQRAWGGVGWWRDVCLPAGRSPPACLCDTHDGVPGVPRAWGRRRGGMGLTCRRGWQAEVRPGGLGGGPVSGRALRGWVRAEPGPSCPEPGLWGGTVVLPPALRMRLKRLILYPEQGAGGVPQPAARASGPPAPFTEATQWLEVAGALADASVPQLPEPVAPGPWSGLSGTLGAGGSRAARSPFQDHTSPQAWSLSAGSTPRARRWPSQTCLRAPA